MLITPKSGVTHSGNRAITKDDYPDLNSFRGYGYQLKVTCNNGEDERIDFQKGFWRGDILNEKGKKTGFYLAGIGPVSIFSAKKEEWEEIEKGIECFGYELIVESLELNVFETWKKQAMPRYGRKKHDPMDGRD